MTIEVELLRIDEVAKTLSVSRRTVFELLSMDELPVIRIGRIVRIPRKALQAWIENRTECSSDRRWVNEAA